MTKQQSKGKGMTKEEAQKYHDFANLDSLDGPSTGLVIALIVFGGVLGGSAILNTSIHPSIMTEVYKCVSFFVTVMFALTIW
jgi:hypothetical protein